MNKQWHTPHGIGNVNEWNIKCLGHQNETNTSSKMTCKQLWNPVDAWQGDVLIKCDAGRIQHDAVQSVISMKVQPKNPKVPPKNEQQVFCLLALLHLCRCQSTSQRAQAPLQQTHGNFGTCPAATSTAGTLKAPRRRGSGKAVPECPTKSKPPS